MKGERNIFGACLQGSWPFHVDADLNSQNMRDMARLENFFLYLKVAVAFFSSFFLFSFFFLLFLSNPV